MTNAFGHEGFPATARMKVIDAITKGYAPVPFSTMAIGEVRDEPTKFNLFAMYFPGSNISYELISTSGEQLDVIGPTRQKILEAQLNPNSIRAKEAELAKLKASGFMDNIEELGDTRDVLGMLGFPLIMVAFGHRVSDGSEAAFVFYPSHIVPKNALEELQQAVKGIVEDERF